MILAFSTLLLISCGEDELTPNGIEMRDDELNEYGCHYYIPEGFTSTKVTYSEFAYTDKTAHCYINPYNEEQLTEMEVDPDITVYNYTRLFMAWNGIPLNNYEYDEETDIAYVEYTSDFGASVEGLSPEYFKWKIMRNGYYLYVATVNCPVDKVEEYTPIFDEWLDYLYIEK